MKKVNINSEKLSAIVAKLRLAPADARRLVALRKEQPFTSAQDFKKRMKLESGEVEKMSKNMAFESEISSSDQELNEAIQSYTNRFCAVCKQITLSPAGSARLSPLLEQLQTVVSLGLASQIRNRIESEVTATQHVLELAESQLELLESTVRPGYLEATTNQPLYRQILLADIPPATMANILLSPSPGLDFKLYQLALYQQAPFIGLPASIRGVGSKLKTVIETVTAQKETLAKLLKLGALAKPWLKYIADVLLMLNDIMEGDGTSIGTPTTGGQTAKCRAIVYLLGIASTGDNLGDDWYLTFNVAGEIKNIGSYFGSPLPDADPIVLRDWWEIGLCGQTNPVSVVFTAMEVDDLDNDLGTPGTQVFNQTCPSGEVKVIQCLVTGDGNKTQTLTATVQVIKECED